MECLPKIMKDAVRFSRPFLETLTEDEEAILYYIYHRHTKRIIRFECVKVVPVFEMLLSTDGLTEEGMKVLASCFLKIAAEYQLPTWGFEKAPDDASPLFFDATPSPGMPAISGFVHWNTETDAPVKNLEGSADE
jgi:hypothetical protein